MQQGGLDEVNRKGWQTVLTKMGIDPNPTNQASVVGYYTACMQTLEISVKATLNPQFGGFQAQGQNQAQQGQAQVQVQHQNTQAQQGFYGNQGYPSQQYQNANQFAQNQRQDFSKSPAVFSNQLQNPAIGNQYQNPGQGQYPGMGFQAQNQPFATQLQGYPNQAYTGNQGFAQQSYGQAQSVSNQQQQAHEQIGAQ